MAIAEKRGMAEKSATAGAETKRDAIRSLVAGGDREDDMTTTTLMASLSLVVSAAFLPSVANAQGSSEEIIVSGRYGRVPDNAQTASQAVSYADLDLSTSAGRDELRHRVNLTARFLCDKLGESATGDSLTPSCRQAAAQDALKRVGTLEEGFAPRGTAWVRPPAWTAPYPGDWARRYP